MDTVIDEGFIYLAMDSDTDELALVLQSLYHEYVQKQTSEGFEVLSEYQWFQQILRLAKKPL